MSPKGGMLVLKLTKEIVISQVAIGELIILNIICPELCPWTVVITFFSPNTG